ncbi:hypothetical protein [Xylocopilactobacillus apis]|uniref:BppU N-terminal domain-containing protein n=1 Tax=Xylocopilactobacillus apis TaxID=2932183 RepID=A0AAU9D3J1_9LACO|nr:hypothetical protein [Xylocopilactobacillus apis]BDR56870.1 hypothetical protein KIMC2_14320 [Xylocopilactobacillus apis]
MPKVINLALENAKVRTVKTDGEVQVAVGDKRDTLRITLMDSGTHQPMNLTNLQPFEFRATNPGRNIIRTRDNFTLESDGVHLDFILPDEVYSQNGLIQDAVIRANVDGDVYSTEHFFILIMPTPGILEMYPQAADALQEATSALRQAIAQMQDATNTSTNTIINELKASAQTAINDLISNLKTSSDKTISDAVKKAVDDSIAKLKTDTDKKISDMLTEVTDLKNSTADTIKQIKDDLPSAQQAITDSKALKEQASGIVDSLSTTLTESKAKADALVADIKATAQNLLTASSKEKPVKDIKLDYDDAKPNALKTILLSLRDGSSQEFSMTETIKKVITDNPALVGNATVDLSNYPTKAELTSGLASKADRTDLAGKADKTALDAKADKTALDAKADKTDLDSKANKTDLDSKANQIYVDTQLSTKADKKDLDTKANAGDLSKFIDQKTFDYQLGMKADAKNFDILQNEVMTIKATTDDAITVLDMTLDPTSKVKKIILDSAGSKTSLSTIIIQDSKGVGHSYQFDESVRRVMTEHPDWFVTKTDLQTKADKSDLTALQTQVSKLASSSGGGGGSSSGGGNDSRLDPYIKGLSQGLILHQYRAVATSRDSSVSSFNIWGCVFEPNFSMSPFKFDVENRGEFALGMIGCNFELSKSVGEGVVLAEIQYKDINTGTPLSTRNLTTYQPYPAMTAFNSNSTKIIYLDAEAGKFQQKPDTTTITTRSQLSSGETYTFSYFLQTLVYPG